MRESRVQRVLNDFIADGCECMADLRAWVESTEIEHVCTANLRHRVHVVVENKLPLDHCVLNNEERGAVGGIAVPDSKEN